ncbi:MAG: histidinol-phosphate transaminase [Thermoleophilia bacterium]
MHLVTSPRLAHIPHYEPGLTTAQVLARYGLEAAVKLASNESPYPPLPQVAEVITAGITSLNRYPDGAARALRSALADTHGVDPGQVAVGNGSCELILLAGQALLDPGTTVVHPEPSFALYPHLAAAAGATAVAVPLDHAGRNDLDAMAAAVDERTRLVILCSPNNPTGGYLAADDIERFLDGLPEDLPVLLDEAYHDFVTELDRGRPLSMARTRPNLLVLRTFSKAHGLCGLRVGYGIGSPAWVAALDRVRQPFNTGTLAQAAAVEALRHPAELQRRVLETTSERERVCAALTGMGVTFTASQANFILITQIGGRAMDGAAVHERLLRGGVIVRNGAALGCAGCLRVSIGTADENDTFLEAMADVAASPDHGDTTTPVAHGAGRKGQKSA